MLIGTNGAGMSGGKRKVVCENEYCESMLYACRNEKENETKGSRDVCYDYEWTVGIYV